MFLAITMGGSGTAPAFTAAFGANVIRKSLIPGTVRDHGGSLSGPSCGQETAMTLGKELIDPIRSHSQWYPSSCFLSLYPDW